MVLEISIVSQLLVDRASITTHLSNINIEDILKEFFSFSEGSNFDSDQETAELLLVLEPILIGMSKFKFQ
jgi:hypothetical protein